MAVEKSPILVKHEVKEKQLRIENVLLMINSEFQRTLWKGFGTYMER